MTTYTDAFGGANIYPSDISYSELTLTADVTLSWPQETSAPGDYATRIIDVSAAAGPLSVVMPDAREAGNGETVLFNNTGSESFLVKDATGIQIVSIGSGEAWQIYLSDNSTEAGSWKSFQYGAGVSSANASALAGNGLVAVGALLNQSLPVTTFNTNYTSGANDRAYLLNWTGASGTLTLPDAATVGADWFIHFRNSGTGAVSVDPDGSVMIDGSSTKSYQPGESSLIVSDGSNFYTVGFGQPATFAFDYTVISVAGTGDYTLSGAELNRITYRFNGVLTGNRNVIVPATVQQYWVDNATTGAFTLTVKTAAGAGVTVGQGARAILYCDGTDVLDADTSTISLPVSITDGGTGASSASAARINLGGTTVGVALFTAASQAAAWSALGNSPGISGGTF